VSNQLAAAPGWSAADLASDDAQSALAHGDLFELLKLS
jgi:hypothetical protein